MRLNPIWRTLCVHLSLHLARFFNDMGYTNVSIFFGGAREWENFDLEMERRPECESY